MTKKQNQPIQAPNHLSPRAKTLWGELVPRRARSPERLALLQTALEALDRADQAKEQLDREGLTWTTKSSGAVHVHPLLKVEKDARGAFAQIWNRLGLFFDGASGFE